MGLWQQPRKTELISKKKFENLAKAKSLFGPWEPWAGKARQRVSNPRATLFSCNYLWVMGFSFSIYNYVHGPAPNTAVVELWAETVRNLFWIHESRVCGSWHCSPSFFLQHPKKGLRPRSHYVPITPKLLQGPIGIHTRWPALCGQTDGPRLTRSIPWSAFVDATVGNHTVVSMVLSLPNHEFPLPGRNLSLLHLFYTISPLPKLHPQWNADAFLSFSWGVPKKACSCHLKLISRSQHQVYGLWLVFLNNRK